MLKNLTLFEGKNEKVRDYKMLRGEKLFDEVLKIINTGRINVYGKPEYSFTNIAVRWTQYLEARGKLKKGQNIDKKDVAFMLADMKMARECHQNKSDNIKDTCGYLAHLSEMQDE